MVGALVTSTDSGLSVPDWPTTYGQNMFTFPISKWVGGVKFEHGHRLFASLVGLITVVLTLGLFLWDARRWVKGLASFALLLVCVQGLLGGLTVRYQLPIAVSSAHGSVAQVFFCLSVWLAWATSSKWEKSSKWALNKTAKGAFLLLALAYLQILIGAVMRHSYAGLAIPTFPMAYGHWVPPFWDEGIVLNFLHTRVGPFLILVGSSLLADRLIRSKDRSRPRLGWFLLGVLTFQIGLGLLTLWSGKLYWVASLHLAGGALFMGTLFSVVLWSGTTRLTIPESALTPVLGARNEWKPATLAP